MDTEIDVPNVTQRQLQTLLAAARAARRAVFSKDPTLKDPKRGSLIVSQLDEALRPFNDILKQDSEVVE